MNTPYGPAHMIGECDHIRLFEQFQDNRVVRYFIINLTKVYDKKFKGKSLEPWDVFDEITNDYIYALAINKNKWKPQSINQ